MKQSIYMYIIILNWIYFGLEFLIYPIDTFGIVKRVRPFQTDQYEQASHITESVF